MTTRISALRHALFDRLGGFDGMDRAVLDLFTRLARDPALPGLVPASGLVDARWQVQLLLTDRLGGPMAYDGPDPADVRARLGVGSDQLSLITQHVLAAFRGVGAAPAALAELEGVLGEAAGWFGGGALESAPTPAGTDPRAGLIALAEADAAEAGVADRPLFVLDADLMLIHQSPDAERGLHAVDSDLRRAFGLGAADLPGHSILRFHPAPSQLQGLLQDVTRLPKETTWCFGQAVWRARLSVLRGPEGRVAGYAIAWRDESDTHRAEAVIRRLRSQAEDLPVPIMYPDAGMERWFGNAACEHALERLASYLPYPVNPLDGVPVELFLPDEAERRAIFHDPARQPYKSQIKMGPETIAILVSPIRDQDQRYLGPQITWEIVHFTRPEDRAPVETRVPPPALAQRAGSASALRGEARALESAAAELQTLVHLLDLVADQAEGQGPGAAETVVTPTEPGASGQAEAAIVTALVAVRRAAEEATGALTAETRGLASELQQRVRDSVHRTQTSAEALGKIMTAATGLSELRAAFGEPAPASPPPVAATAAPA